MVFFNLLLLSERGIDGLYGSFKVNLHLRFVAEQENLPDGMAVEQGMKSVWRARRATEAEPHAR
jgi:hypothetical protein